MRFVVSEIYLTPELGYNEQHIVQNVQRSFIADSIRSIHNSNLSLKTDVYGLINLYFTLRFVVTEVFLTHELGYNEQYIV